MCAGSGAYACSAGQCERGRHGWSAAKPLSCASTLSSCTRSRLRALASRASQSGEAKPQLQGQRPTDRLERSSTHALDNRGTHRRRQEEGKRMKDEQSGEVTSPQCERFACSFSPLLLPLPRFVVQSSCRLPPAVTRRPLLPAAAVSVLVSVVVLPVLVAAVVRAVVVRVSALRSRAVLSRASSAPNQPRPRQPPSPSHSTSHSPHPPHTRHNRYGRHGRP